MKVYRDIEQRTEEWHELRKGKVTGTMAGRILSDRKDVRDSAFYEVVADRLSTASVEQAEENAMTRGVRLEDEAVAKFAEKTKKNVERVGFVESSFSKWSGYSPDGLIKKGKKYTEDIETKCLKSGNHVRAWLTGKVPKDYMPQVLQGFVANDDLQRRHVVFYDPRIEIMPMVIITVERDEVEVEIEKSRAAQVDFINRVDALIASVVKL